MNPSQNIAILIILFLLPVITYTSNVNGQGITDNSPYLHLKSLEIKGPMISEVDENISFTVTSEGMPVANASVLFAGYEKKTNIDGEASFQIDFAGSFKAIAEKKGYETNSTLLWVFPKGNKGFKVRSTKSVSDPQLAGDFDSAGRMAGFNYARIKAYYTVDDKGNIYPIIITDIQKLSNEAIDLIKRYYGGNISHHDMWVRVPEYTHQENLMLKIFRVREWGFKIFLQVWIHYVKPGVGEGQEPPRDFLKGEALQNYLEQRKELALSIATFARKYDVEILDPFGQFFISPSKEFLAYKKLLPKLREIYNGKLALMLDAKYLKKDIFNLTGFDYLVVLPNQAGYSEEEMHNFLNFTVYLQDKYRVKILPMYFGHLDCMYRKFSSEATFEKTINRFGPPENLRMWIISFILNESLKMGIKDVDVHPLWFFEMYYSIPGVSGKNFSYWPTKKPLDLVAKIFCKPWNKEKRRTERLLGYIKLAKNLIINKSQNPTLTKWVLNKITMFYKAYRDGYYNSADINAQEILGLLFYINNPLNISIDGDGYEWKELDPIYFNPSKTYPYFNPLFRLGRKEIEKTENLKAVYAVNDPKYLYIMLEFYRRPPKWLPVIDIDTSGEWTHEDGKEFQIPLHRGLSDLWKVSYTGMKSGHLDPQNSNSTKIGNAEVKVGEVVELRIPLKFLDNPKKINLLVWYPTMIPWGDMEIDIVNWNTSPQSTLLVSASSKKFLIGKNITLSGFIYPAYANATVTLTYMMPNETILVKNVTSGALGDFKDNITPNIAGDWTVKASLNLNNEENISTKVSFTIPIPIRKHIISLNRWRREINKLI